MRLAMAGPMPRICPEARYFSMPSAPVGGVGLQDFSLELEPMGAVAHPEPLAVIHSPADRRRMANDCHKITLAPCLHLQDAEAVLGIVEGDALDRAR